MMVRIVVEVPQYRECAPHSSPRGPALTLVIVYAPRNEADLVQVKRITAAAWNLALSDG